MKKQLLIIPFFVGLTLWATESSFAQDESEPKGIARIDPRLSKGTISVGGVFGLDLHNAENEGQALRLVINDRSNDFSMRLESGYAVKDYTFVGLGFIYESINSNGTYELTSTSEIVDIQSHGNTYGFKPYIKNYLPISQSKRFNLAMRTDLGYTIEEKLTQTTDSDDEITRKFVKERTVDLGLNPGIQAFLVRNFGVEASISAAGFEYTNKQITETNKEDTAVNDTSLDLRFELLQLNLGFLIYF